MAHQLSMITLKRILSILVAGGLTFSITSCCHWKNCSVKSKDDAMPGSQTSGMGGNHDDLHRPPLAQPASCCCDELIADGSFEFESSSASLQGSGPYEGLSPSNDPSRMIGPWYIFYTEPPTTDPNHPSSVGIVANNYNANPLLYPTPCGNLCIYLGLAGGTNLIGPNGIAGPAYGNNGPYPKSILSQAIYTKLKAGKNYKLCFSQSAFAYAGLQSVAGEVQVELDNAQGVAFSGNWKVKSGSDWVMQSTNITVTTDDWYTIKLISSSTKNVAIIDGVSLRGPN